MQKNTWEKCNICQQFSCLLRPSARVRLLWSQHRPETEAADFTP